LISKGLEHELTPDLRRAHHEPSMAWADPPRHALSSMIDPDPVANLCFVLRQGHKRLQNAPQGGAFITDRLRSQAE